MYESVLENRQTEVSGDQSRFPFIVVEGLDGTGKRVELGILFYELCYGLSSGKTTATRILSQRLKATLTHTPPSCIDPLRNLYDDHILRSAYYAFGNYIAAIQISDYLKKQPVVLDRYLLLLIDAL